MTYTPEDLRADIRSAELSVAALRRGAVSDDVLALLRLLDRIQAGTDTLVGAGVDLRAELSRIDTVHNTLSEKAHIASAALAAQGGPAAQRAQEEEAPGHWWWYLDEHVREDRMRRAKRTAWTVLGVAAVLAVLILLYNVFLRPDKETRLQFDQVIRAEGKVDQGEYAEALAHFERALEIVPDDPEVVLMVALMHEALGHTEEAAEYHARAQALYEMQVDYWATLSQKYFQLGWYKESEAAALKAVDLDDQYALAYCALGSAYEGQGRLGEAIGAVQRCADLARERREDALYVIAASRLAMLLQAPPVPISPDTQVQGNSE